MFSHIALCVCFFCVTVSLKVCNMITLNTKCFNISCFPCMIRCQVISRATVDAVAGYTTCTDIEYRILCKHVGTYIYM